LPGLSSADGPGNTSPFSYLPKGYSMMGEAAEPDNEKQASGFSAGHSAFRARQAKAAPIPTKNRPVRGGFSKERIEGDAAGNHRDS
jgi:hypothetical protein